MRSRAGRGASAPDGSYCAPGSGHGLHGAARVTIVSETNVTDSSASNNAAVIYVCITCRRASDPDAEPRPGAILAEATAKAAEGTGVVVRPIRCLANCTRGPSAAMRCNGSWTYVFGGLDVVCGPALVEGARRLASAADGLMPWRGRPDALKRGLIARMPPIDFMGDGFMGELE